jgi:hypothetical protein
MDERYGLRMGGDEDQALLTDTITRITLALIDTVPPGTVDGGTLATALTEITAHAVSAMFPRHEHGPVVEHLQHYLMKAVEKYDNDKRMIEWHERQERERG